MQKLLNFQKAFDQFCVDYAIENIENIDSELKKDLTEMIQKNIIINGKIKYNLVLDDLTTMPIFKMN